MKCLFILPSRALYSTAGANAITSRHYFPPNFKLQTDSKPQSLCRHGRLHDALIEMSHIRFDAQFSAYDALITECFNGRAFREGQIVHSHMIKTIYRPSVYLATRLLIMYVNCEALGDARSVLDEMPERSIVSWTAMISGYSQRGYRLKALELFVQMMETGMLPNEFTLATVLTSCVGIHGLGNGRQIHALAMKINFDSHVFVGSSLLDMYAKAGEIQEARKAFDMMPVRDVVSCTAIISGYAQLGLDEEALDLFRKLHIEGMKCNYVTFASLLTALSGLAALDYGRQVHGFVIRCELPFFVVLQNSLIDMYSKCGSLSYARKVFESMPERSVISWNTMLVGYGKHGLGTEVIQLFKSMHQEVKPDSVTLMAVLSGCSHSGLVDDGLDAFDFMINDLGMKPEIGHYGCVIDLLGRAGKIEKAMDIIRTMPFKPTPALWGSLLGACRAHANVSNGEIVAKKLLDVEPENAGNYVILSNIYAASGRWADVARVRELMNENVVIKKPGRSLISINKMMHTFHSNDRVHPQIEQINAKVLEIYAKIREFGYVPDLSCVLHDVDIEQKERILLRHSEKLAIAFGLMNSSSSELIRVIKNLRICVDCHNFAKYVSKVYGIDISIRDSNRFHLFVGGACTCKDFW